MKTKDYGKDVDTDQKLIGRHEYLEIEDKGATEAEKKAAAAMAAVDIVEPAPRKNRAGWWWAAAIFALLAVGGCIYLSTKDGKIATESTASITGKASSAISTASKTASGAVKNAKDKVVSAIDVVGNKSAKAFDAISDKSAKAIDVLSDKSAEALALSKYPVATESMVKSNANRHRTVDYLYYFGNDQSAVAENAVLNDIAEAAKVSDADITITAYASPTGSAAYNANLCEQRAENLEDYLVAHGVSADHIKIVAGGQTNQFGSDAYCRRADIVVDYAG